MKNNDEYCRLLESLTRGAYTIEKDGLEIEVRNCADREEGRLDPRTFTAMTLTPEMFRNDKENIDPELWGNMDHMFMPENAEQMTPLEIDRAWFGWTAIDYAAGVRTKVMNIDIAEGKLRILTFEEPSLEKDRPCMVWIHGGGFYAGDVDSYVPHCRLLAQKSGGVVVEVDYTLAPELRYPGNFDQCYAALEWVYENADKLGISRKRIGIGGDSAGANIALACAVRDRNEGKGMLSYESLIYPLVDMTQTLEKNDYWAPEKYYNPENDPMVAGSNAFIGTLMERLMEYYLASPEQAEDIYASPLKTDLNGLPKTLLITMEYDYLREEGEACAIKMKKAGTDVRCIRYGGVVHATFDRLHYAPQSEDMIDLMAEDLKRL